MLAGAPDGLFGRAPDGLLGRTPAGLLGRAPLDSCGVSLAATLWTRISLGCPGEFSELLGGGREGGAKGVGGVCGVFGALLSLATII